MLKKVLFILYAIVILVMAMATFVERSEGTEYVAQNFYGSWWFSLLWALLTAAGVTYIIKVKMRRPSLVVLHLSFVVILLGALLTHLTSKQGLIHLRMGETNTELGFGITLKSFDVKYHEGTMAPYDYISRFTITSPDPSQGGENGGAKITSPDPSQGGENDGAKITSPNPSQGGENGGAKTSPKGVEKNSAGKTSPPWEGSGEVSMNNIYSHNSYRLYQSSYDSDGKGSILSYNSDPYGIPVTYLGYILLFISLIWMMIDPKGRFRKAITSPPALSKGAGAGLFQGKSIIILFLFFSQSLFAESTSSSLDRSGGEVTISEADAKLFSHLCIDYNERICPMETFALDFCKTVTGSRSYNGLNASQVLAGFLLYSDQWMTEPCIKVKSSELRERMSLGDHISAASLFDQNRGGYILGPYVQEYYRGNKDAFHKAVVDIDDKVMLIMQVRQQALLKIFPYHGHWYAPTDRLPARMNKDQQLYIHNAVSILAMLEHQGTGQSQEMLLKMQKYQYRYGGEAIPSKTRLQAENIYNAVPFVTILAIVCLCLGIISIFFTNKIPFLVNSNQNTLPSGRAGWGFLSGWGLLALAWLTLTFVLALRWIISGTVPMANGYESMLMMAWLVQIMALLMHRRFPVMVSFGLLLSGFFLLVSHIGQMTPAINHIMPVLQSPLLSIHVSIIMMAYALLSITAICSVFALVSKKQRDEMTRLSTIIHYPAMACLGIGIFIGAIWANVSWGTYWSWDPKETWALITFLIYAVPLHTASVSSLQKPRAYHIYMFCAFLSVIITYFGVNYLMTGMHSYA